MDISEQAVSIEEALRQKGPELWYAGSKFKKGFLAKWLQRPYPLRPYRYNSLSEKNDGAHPALGQAESGDVAAYLETLTAGEVLKKADLAGADVQRGRRIFIVRQACYSCHIVESGQKLVGGSSGPVLAGAGKRLEGRWVMAYLLDPAAFRPFDPMPRYSGVLAPDELRDLAAYVSGLE